MFVTTKKRKNRVAILGEHCLRTDHLEMIAEGIVKTLTVDNIVYTVSSDKLGRQVRRVCKEKGIRTFNRKVRPLGIGASTDLSVLQELVVAGLAWRVELFYCVYDPDVRTLDAKNSFARHGMNIHARMNNLLNCKEFVYNRRLFNGD